LSLKRKRGQNNKKVIELYEKLYRDDMNEIEVIVIILLQILKYEKITIGKRGRSNVDKLGNKIPHYGNSRQAKILVDMNYY